MEPYQKLSPEQEAEREEEKRRFYDEYDRLHPLTEEDLQRIEEVKREMDAKIRREFNHWMIMYSTLPFPPDPFEEEEEQEK